MPGRAIRLFGRMRRMRLGWKSVSHPHLKRFPILRKRFPILGKRFPTSLGWKLLPGNGNPLSKVEGPPKGWESVSEKGEAAALVEIGGFDFSRAVWLLLEAVSHRSEAVSHLS